MQALKDIEQKIQTFADQAEQQGKVFTCGWCGAKGELIDYEGDGINSSGDV